MTQIPIKDRIHNKLKNVGLRPTRQRTALGRILFQAGHRHVTAEMLHEEALRHSIPVSLATVYNTLHQFTEAGLLHELPVHGSKTYFDTNLTDHHHFYCERDGKLMDIPNDQMQIVGIPDAPLGKKISRVDIVVRIEDED